MGILIYNYSVILLFRALKRPSLIVKSRGSFFVVTVLGTVSNFLVVSLAFFQVHTSPVQINYY